MGVWGRLGARRAPPNDSPVQTPGVATQAVKTSEDPFLWAMRLVVCVDRDDDLGQKAGIRGPVVGRQQVLEAAMSLGTADPSDADTNAMFAAVHLLDEIRKVGEDCEVVLLTGSPKVGVLSDRKVAEQFDSVLARIPAQSAHLVSDGAEDEYLFPILASRVKIDGVHRIYIRQNASIESTYYTVVRALKDPKLRAKTVLPLAFILLTLGIAAAGGVIVWGIIGLAILLGIYLIFWTFDIDEALIDSIRSASTDIRQGSVAFGFGLFALALVGVGFLSGYNQYLSNVGQTPIDRLLLFTQSGLLWWLLSAQVWESGRAIRRYFTYGKVPRSFAIATTSIVGIGFLSYGIIYLVKYLESALPAVQTPLLVACIVLGLALVISAGVLQQYLKARAAATTAGTPVS
jgi:putative membrane protein